MSVSPSVAQTRVGPWLVMGAWLTTGSAFATDGGILDQPALEPDTVYNAHPWYDGVQPRASAALARIPTQVQDGLGHSGSVATTLMREGLPPGDNAVIPGAPQTLKDARQHLGTSAQHHGQAVQALPQHLSQGAEAFRTGAAETWQAAQRNADHTVQIFHQERENAAREKADTQRRLDSLERESDLLAQRATRTGEAGVTRAIERGNTRLHDAYHGAPEQTATALQDLPGHAARAVVLPLKAAREIATAAVHQTPRNVEWTTHHVDESVRTAHTDVRDAADRSQDRVVQARSRQIETLEFLEQAEDRMQERVQTASRGRAASVRNWYAMQDQRIREHTVQRVGPNLHRSWNMARKDARDLWIHGWEDSFKGGLTLAGDNLFAGDVEGAVMGGHYSLAGAAEGAAYVLLLEPLAFTAHGATAAGQATGLTVAGASLLTALAGGHALAVLHVLFRNLGDVLGVKVTADLLKGGAWLTSALAVTAVAGFGVVDTVTWFHLGVLHTATVAAWGVARTVGTVFIGAMGAATLATLGILAFETWVFTRCVVAATAPWLWALIQTVPATVETAVVSTGHVLGTALQLTALGTVLLATRAFLPPLAVISMGNRVARVAFHGWLDQLVKTPAQAVGNAVKATAKASWALARDPLLGGLYLVAGTGGAGFRITTLASVAGMAGAALTVHTLGSAHARALGYGGMWSAAATASAIERATAPVRLDWQSAWKEEREPQLREMLSQQDESVRNQVGDDITYIRVVFSGEDRGKVNFFNVERDGKRTRFFRHVEPDCQVVYRAESGLTLSTGQHDGRCLQARATTEEGTP